MLYRLLLLLHLSFCWAQVGRYKCPLPWIEYADKCYKYELVQSSLDEAKQICENDGASLVSVNSRDEHEAIADWLANSPSSLEWYTSGYKQISHSTDVNEQKVLFYWEGDGLEVQGAQYWLSNEDRNKDGDRIIYKFNGARWGWTLIEDPTTPRSLICEISKRETYKIIDTERGFDYGLPILDTSLLERGPKFALDPQDQIYEATDDNPVTFVEFRCEADANPYANYNWYRMRQSEVIELDPISETKLTITNGRLVIHTPRDSVDNGDYYCQARNHIGAVLSKSATLRFGYLNDFPDSTRKAVVVDAHKGIGMPCNPPKHGYDSLSYSWYKDKVGSFIFSDLKPHIFTSRDGTLYFSTATKDDQGYYTCVVAVPDVRGGKHSQPIPLNVTESSGNVYEPEMVNGFPKVFPSSPLRTDDIYIECVAWGSLPLDYRWEREDEVMPPHVQMLDNRRVLHIPNVQVEHSGRYTCTVTRRNGQSTTNTATLEIRARPYFPIQLPDQHVDKNADLTWRCYGKGAPQVRYSWFRDAEPLMIEEMVPEDLQRFSIDNNVLRIANVKERDEGMYQCKIVNTLGTAYSSAQLRTIAFAPTFDKYPIPPNQYTTLDSTMTIICSPEAAPKSDKLWYKDGRAMNLAGPESGDTIHKLANGNLFIDKVRQSDAGTYTCKASNSLGEAESFGNLTILSSTSIGHNALSQQHVRVNSTAVLFCDAYFNPVLDLTYDWWHNNYHIVFERLRVGSGNIAYFELDDHFRRGMGINRGSLFINQVQQWHAGKYRCIAKTSSDDKEAESLLEVVGPPSPPAGVTGETLNSTAVRLTWWPGANNGDVTEYFIVEGFILLEQLWRRYKTNIRPRGFVTIEQQVTDEVNGLSPGNQYRFRVRAVNSHGEGEPSDPTEQIYYTDPAPPRVAPTGLRGGGGKVGTLVMEWDPLPPADRNGPGLQYIIHWKKSSVADEDKWETHVLLGVENTRYVHNVYTENFFTEYNIKVQAKNVAGYGNMSDIISTFSAEDMPVEVPKEVKAVYFNSTAITVHWDPVPDTRISMRGRLKGYRINYWMQDVEDETMGQFKIIEGQNSQGIILGLYPATRYVVNVQVLNSAGLTAVSEDYTTRTLRHAPIEAPQEVKMRITNDHEIEVHWRGVSTTIMEEPLEGYMLRIWRRGENIYVAKDYDVGKTARKVISDLEPNIMYELRVYGYSRAGVGLQSSPIIEFILGANCRIMEDSPDKKYVYLCDSCGRSTMATSLAFLVTVFHLLRLPL